MCSKTHTQILIVLFVKEREGGSRTIHPPGSEMNEGFHLEENRWARDPGFFIYSMYIIR